MHQEENKNQKRSRAVWEITPLPRYKREWCKVVCFLPVYLPGGRNGCRIYYDNNETEDIPYTLDWVLNDWAGHRATSVALLQRQSANWLDRGKHRRLPLVLNAGFCMVPVKVRCARKRNDGVSGYVALQKIQNSYSRQDGSTCLSFHTCTRQLVVLEQPRTLQDNIQLGWRLLQCAQQIYGGL